MKKNVVSWVARLLIAIYAGNCFASQDVKHAGDDFVRGGIDLTSDVPQVESGNVSQDALTIDSALLEAAEEEWRKSEELKPLEKKRKIRMATEPTKGSKGQNEVVGDSVRSKKLGKASKKRKTSIRAGDMKQAKDLAKIQHEYFENKRSEDKARREKNDIGGMKSESEYLSDQHSLIKALNSVMGDGYFNEDAKLSDCMGAWSLFRTQNPFEDTLSQSEHCDQECAHLILETEKFLKSSIAYCEAILGFRKEYCLKEFCEIIKEGHMAERDRLEISSNELLSVRKVFLEIFYGVKCMKHLSRGIAAISSGKKCVDCFDGLEKTAHGIALKYLATSPGPASASGLARAALLDPVLESIFEVEDSLLIAGMLRRDEELKDQAKLIMDYKGYEDKYLDNLVEAVRDEQLKKLARALDRRYNTCYMDNGASWALIAAPREVHTRIGKKVLQIQESLNKLSKAISQMSRSTRTKTGPRRLIKQLIKQYSSLTQSLESLLICAQRTMNLGCIRLSLGDFITLLEHLNARSDGGWLHKKFCGRLSCLIDEIISAVKCLELCDDCASALGCSLDSKYCGKLLLDRSGNPITYKGALNLEYFNILDGFKRKLVNLEAGVWRPGNSPSRVHPSELPGPQENMLLTPEDFYYICKELERNISADRSVQEGAGSLSDRLESEPSVLRGVQPESKTQEVAGKRKPVEHEGGRKKKARRLNP